MKISVTQGAPWQLDVTKEVSMNEAPKHRISKERNGLWKEMVHKALKHLLASEQWQVVVTNEWMLCVASAPVGRGRCADGLFYSFFVVFRSEETTTSAKRLARSSLVDLDPLGSSLLFIRSEL